MKLQATYLKTNGKFQPAIRKSEQGFTDRLEMLSSVFQTREEAKQAAEREIARRTN